MMFPIEVSLDNTSHRYSIYNRSLVINALYSIICNLHISMSASGTNQLLLQTCETHDWLVVYLLISQIWVRQLGLWNFPGCFWTKTIPKHQPMTRYYDVLYHETIGIIHHYYPWFIVRYGYISQRSWNTKNEFVSSDYDFPNCYMKKKKTTCSKPPTRHEQCSKSLSLSIILVGWPGSL